VWTVDETWRTAGSPGVIAISVGIDFDDDLK